ncbi:MAG: hypothetical protein QOF10_7018, partial [Kribbellaceae bacterium]|nr:hypothetical protein [Kribbellaceae bacterium]
PDPRTRYELADALYDQLIGWVSWQAGSESAKPEPDQAEVIRLKARATQLAADREALDPTTRRPSKRSSPSMPTSSGSSSPAEGVTPTG